MSDRRRQGNNPKRRIASADQLNSDDRKELAQSVRYVGSGHHKRWPADYGFERISPRPTKSLCDMQRVILHDEAKRLLERGVAHGMVSSLNEGNFPKFIWCVDEQGEVYEAKTDIRNPGAYHGYRLEEDDDMRDRVIWVWRERERCRQNGV